MKTIIEIEDAFECDIPFILGKLTGFIFNLSFFIICGFFTVYFGIKLIDIIFPLLGILPK